MSLTTGSSAKKPFTFLDFPAEIRDRIYEYAFTPNDPAPANPTDAILSLEFNLFDHGLAMNLLRTCKLVHDEGCYILHKQHHLVQIIANDPIDAWLPTIKRRRLPILGCKRGRPYTSGFAMTHWVAKYCDYFSVRRCFIILHRDLDAFMKILKDFQWAVGKDKEVFEHRVFLHHPYKPFDSSTWPCRSNTARIYPPVIHRRIQKALLSPYKRLCQFSNLSFPYKGQWPELQSQDAFDADLKAPVLTAVRRAVTSKPDKFLRIMRAKQLTGEDYLAVGDYSSADATWESAIMMMYHCINSKAGKQLKRTGGLPFLNSLASWLFDVSMLRATTVVETQSELPERVRRSDERKAQWRNVGQLTQLRQFEKLLEQATWAPSAVHNNARAALWNRGMLV